MRLFFEPLVKADNTFPRRVHGEMLQSKFVTDGDFVFFWYDMIFVEQKRRIQSTNFRFSDDFEQNTFTGTSIKQNTFSTGDVEQNVYGGC